MRKLAKLTEHSKKRLKERCGFSRGTSSRMAEKALKYGISHKETTGELNRWLSGQYLKYKKGNNIRLYGDMAYIFQGTMLLTVLYIPKNLLTKAHALEKRKKVMLPEEIRKSE